MIPPHTHQSLTTNLLPSILLPPLPTTTTTTTTTHLHQFPNKPRFNLSLSKLSRKSPFHPPPLRCSLSAVVSDHLQLTNTKPFPAEVSRTIMELSSAGTLSALTRVKEEEDTWPLGVGVRFAVDPDDGTPLVCLNAVQARHFAFDKRSSLNVQQCGLRTPQCTILGNLHKPDDPIVQKKLQSLWEKKFGEQVNNTLLYILAVERVLQIEDFMEDDVWIKSSDYRLASPDPLRDFAEKIVLEINAHNMEDVHRFCNIYVDSDIQVAEAKMVWVDRLGFDMRLSSPQNDVFEVRIPFPREVTDEKGAKSSFNCMSQLAWEVEKNFLVPDFQKVKQLKKIPCKGC